MINEKKGIVLINEATGERKDFSSINGAAVFLQTVFANVQRVAMYNGTLRGWRVYYTPETIRRQIRDLEDQLQLLEG